jgi:hypothetical protein
MMKIKKSEKKMRMPYSHMDPVEKSPAFSFTRRRRSRGNQ